MHGKVTTKYKETLQTPSDGVRSATHWRIFREKRRDLAHATLTVAAVISIAVLHHYTPHSSLLGHNFFQ